MIDKTFQLFDTDKDGKVSFMWVSFQTVLIFKRKFISGMSTLIKGLQDDKYKCKWKNLSEIILLDLFELWDLNGDGLMSKDEFYEYVKATSLTFTDKKTLKAIVESTITQVDLHGKGFIRYLIERKILISKKA